MDYKKVYDQIIDNRKHNEVTDYTENHHIIPRSLGGDDDSSNLVRLTAREHFLCHYLLAKMYPKETQEWYKMNHAFLMMKCESMFNSRYYNSRLYAALRKNFSSVMSIIQSGKNNSQYGTMWICNMELKESKTIKKDDPIPEGWIKGRNNWNKRVKKNKEDYKSPGRYQQHEFDNKVEDMVGFYTQGNSVSQCLRLAGFCGTGGAHKRLQQVLKNRGIYLRVAQWTRAKGFYPLGWEFESLHGGQNY